jgi:Arc/MetJ-type ribon-helix-helix transcriptional regulator
LPVTKKRHRRSAIPPEDASAPTKRRGARRCTLNFALSPDLRDWVKGQVGAAAYNSASQYLCALIRRDREQVSMLDHLRDVLHYDDASRVPSWDELAASGRRQDSEAWEAVFRHILKLKRAAAGRAS